jgi:uncharacterized membrane protein YeaQ/YmgE (transglycosylase-associated protein family)
MWAEVIGGTDAGLMGDVIHVSMKSGEAQASPRHALSLVWACAVIVFPQAVRAFSTERYIMGIQGLIVFLLIGAVAGWLAGIIMKGFGFGLIGNMVVGIVGAFVAGLVLPMVGVSIGGGIVGSIIHATIGAVILLFLIGLVRKR